MSWYELQLGEVINIKHGWAFKGEFFADEGEFVLLTPGNFWESGGLKLKGEKEKYYTDNFPEEFLLSEGDMLVVMTDLKQTAPILGASLIIPQDKKFLHNQRLGLVQIQKPSKIDYKFLYYAFNSPIYRSQIRASATGATVRHTAPERIYKCKIPCPRDITTQKRIGEILSKYDNLIDNNNRRIAVLEESIHLLYKDWFVRLRFPGYESVKVVDGIPDGWEIVTISDLYSTSSGGTPSRKKHDEYYQGGNIPWIKTQELKNRWVIDTEEKITESGLSNSSAKLFPKGTFIIAMYGATIGQFGIIAKESTTNQACCALIYNPDSLFNYAYAFGYLLTEREKIISLGQGSAQPNISQQVIKKLSILKPSENIIKEYNSIVQPWLDAMLYYQIMNVKLKQARDLLLPRLMSGSIIV